MFATPTSRGLADSVNLFAAVELDDLGSFKRAPGWAMRLYVREVER